MNIYPPYHNQQVLMRALALEKAKEMATRDLEIERLLSMSASERNMYSFPTNVQLQYETEPPQTPYTAPNPHSNPPVETTESINNIPSPKSPKKASSAAKQTKNDTRTMLFEKTGSKKDLTDTKSKIAPKLSNTTPKPSASAAKTKHVTKSRIDTTTSKEKEGKRNEEVVRKNTTTSAGAERNVRANSTLERASVSTTERYSEPSAEPVADGLPQEMLAHLEDMLKNHNPGMTAKMDQSRFVRDETDIAVKTLQQWHHQHPSAQPSDLAAVVSRLAEKLLVLQNPPPPPPPPFEPIPNFHPPPRPLPPKLSKSQPLKRLPPARKKRPAKPHATRPPPPQFAPIDHSFHDHTLDDSFNNLYNELTEHRDIPPYPVIPRTFKDTGTNVMHLPPKPSKAIGTNTVHTNHNPTNKHTKKHDYLAEWQDSQRHASEQVGRDWLLMHTQQPLASNLAARMGRNVYSQVDAISRMIFEDLCEETALLLTDLEGDAQSFNAGGSSHEILEQHRLANEMKHIVSELETYEKQEKQLVADTHHELITQAQERSSTDNTTTQKPISFTSAPPVKVVLPPVESILAGVKEYSNYLKKRNGGADPVSIGNKVAEAILAEVLDSTASDIFGVCDSYVDRIIKKEFVV